MDFKLNEMEQEILDMLHDFCLKEVKPIAAELDEKEEFTQNAREKLAEMGMLGTYIPEEYGGVGLGLSLVWEIADLHGGSVWVEKSSDKGTTIAVELPTQQSTKS